MQNHYHTLEIEYGASLDSIKQAYRRLAMKWHPDRNLNQHHTHKKFQEISHAYSILSSDKKLSYDQNYWLYLQQYGKHPQNKEFNNLSSNHFNNTTTENHSQKQISKIRVKIQTSFKDAILGCLKNYTIKEPYTEQTFNVSLNIPPNTIDGDVLHIQHSSFLVEFHIQVHEHLLFKVKDLDVYSFIEVPVITCIIGGYIPYRHWTGLQQVYIPPSSNPSDIITVKGLGINKKTNVGNLMLSIKIRFPTDVCTEQQKHLKSFEYIEKSKHTNNSFNEKLKDIWIDK
jgi:DnaJ-class molecular chaperone